jgi:iron complex outermembrane recepter protein
MNRLIKVLTLALTLVSAGFLANISFAADALEEIVVTAQKRSESEQTVPIAITALTTQDLNNAGVDSITDLTMVAPGLQLERTAIFATPYVRGVGSNATGPGNDPSVATYMDGVYLSSKSANLFDLYNIERVEVLKGPQGTLFGRNATGGAINIVTRNPTDTPEA